MTGIALGAGSITAGREIANTVWQFLQRIRAPCGGTFSSAIA
jgi:hypothetical protein